MGETKRRKLRQTVKKQMKERKSEKSYEKTEEYELYIFLKLRIDTGFRYKFREKLLDPYV